MGNDESKQTVPPKNPLPEGDIPIKLVIIGPTAAGKSSMLIALN